MVRRFSVLPYANAMPLVHFLEDSSLGAQVLYRFPRESISALFDGQVDVALVPVVDFFACPDLQMIPGLGIAADGDVTSVLLRCHRPLQQVRTIALDPESKTSNVLARIIVERYFRLPQQIEYTHDSEGAEASVCIGDRALRAAPSLETYDLAGQWKRMTGLPFVFAVWVVRRSCPDIEAVTEVLRVAKDRGLQSRRYLAHLCSQRLGLPEDRCHEYLTQRLHYDLGPGDVEAMSLFRKLAAEFREPAGSHAVHTVSARQKECSTPTLEWR